MNTYEKAQYIHGYLEVYTWVICVLIVNILERDQIWNRSKKKKKLVEEEHLIGIKPWTSVAQTNHPTLNLAL